MSFSQAIARGHDRRVAPCLLSMTRSANKGTSMIQTFGDIEVHIIAGVEQYFCCVSYLRLKRGLKSKKLRNEIMGTKK